MSRKGEMIAAQSNLFGSRGKLLDASALVPQDDGTIRLGNVHITAVGLRFGAQLTEVEYDALTQFLLAFEKARPWLIGDYVAYSNEVGYGDIPSIAAQFGREAQTAMNWASVCRAVEFSRRREDLSFTHHTLVAGLPDDEQARWLAMAAAGDDGKRWSVRRLRAEIFGEGSPKPTDAERLIDRFYGWTIQRQEKFVAEMRRWLAEVDL